MDIPVPIWFFLIGLLIVAGAIYFPAMFAGWYWVGIAIAFLGILLAFTTGRR